MAWPTSERIESLVVFGPDTDSRMRPAGLLSFEGRDKRQSRFRYARTWLENRSTRRELFPTGLPLGSKAIASTPHNVPLPFYDAGPDGWGKAVMERAFPNRKMDMGEYLALAGDERSGDLSFGPDATGPERWMPGKPLVEMTDGEQYPGGAGRGRRAVRGRAARRAACHPAPERQRGHRRRAPEGHVSVGGVEMAG